jgi:hypothetical protein
MKKHQIIRRLTLAFGVVIMAAAGVATVAQTDPGAAQRENAQALKKYEWKSRTEIKKDGDTKKDQLSQMSYDLDGNLQQSVIGSMPEKDLPSFGLRGAIAQKKKREFLEKLEELKALAKSYGALPPERMKLFMSTASKTPETGFIRIEGTNVLHTGDAMTMWIDATTRRQRRVEIVTSMNDKIVHIVTEFQNVSEAGPTYVARNQVNYNGNAIVIITENFDYTPSRLATESARANK